jgi:phosphatidylserine/phosphatidylglycerophosphate/cardiolipin synthase-like enzyme
MMWARYYAFCRRHPAAVETIETALAEFPEDETWTIGELERAAIGVSFDIVANALEALEDIGVVRRVDDRQFRLRAKEYQETKVARASARAALLWVDKVIPQDECDLLLAIPPDFETARVTGVAREFGDLRTALRALVAAASRRLVIASPFWDREAADDLGTLFERRLRSGVELVLIMRRPESALQNSLALDTIRERCGEFANFKVAILDTPSAIDRFRSSTFHFKAACADGAVAYVGSANFNAASLTSRWELGVILRGGHARRISELLDQLVRRSVPFIGVTS